MNCLPGEDICHCSGQCHGLYRVRRVADNEDIVVLTGSLVNVYPLGHGENVGLKSAFVDHPLHRALHPRLIEPCTNVCERSATIAGDRGRLAIQP